MVNVRDSDYGGYGGAERMLASGKSCFSQNIHSSECKDQGHRDLCPGVHFEIPDQEDWKCSQSKVTYSADSGMGVRRVRDDLRIHTFAFGASTLVHRPKVNDGTALEHNNEEVDDAENCHPS